MEGKNIRKLKSGCRTNIEVNQEAVSASTDLFDKEWEVFVIKKDKGTGNFVGKVACCALAPV